MLTRRSWLIGTGTAALVSTLPAAAARPVATSEPLAATPELLRTAARGGLASRLGAPLPRYTARLEQELSILVEDSRAVRKLLVLHDLAAFARRSGIELGPGRGAASGSLVCWALGITDLDPVHHELLFERFYDPNATHEPFLDLDVCERRRDELVDYLVARHGADRVAVVRSPFAELEPQGDPTLWGDSRKLLVAQSPLETTTTGRWPTVELGAWERYTCVTFELVGQQLDAFPLCDEGFTDVLQRVRPQSLEELAAALALYRPGTLEAGWVDGYIDAKHRRRAIQPLPPIAAAIVEPTYGFIIYQEQLMRIASAATGMSLADANRLRRDLGARRNLRQHRARFIRNATTVDAAALFDRLQHDAPYTFCRAHALSLATLARRSIQRVRSGALDS